MAGRPSKNYSYSGGGRRGGKTLLGALVDRGPQLESDAPDAEGPTPGGATVDVAGLDVGEAKLRERGIKTPIYKKPGFFTNLLTAGAAGEQANDANTRALFDKNKMLADIASQETRYNQDQQLEQLRAKNSERQATVQMLTQMGISPTEANIARYDAANSGLAIEAAGGGFKEKFAKSLLGTTESNLRRGAIENNPQVFTQEHLDKARTAGITNAATADANNRANEMQPWLIDEQAFSRQNQPQRKQLLAAQAEAADIANQRNVAQKPFWGIKEFSSDGMFAGDMPGGTPLTQFSGPRSGYEQIEVPPAAPGLPPTYKQIRVNQPAQMTRSILAGFDPAALGEEEPQTRPPLRSRKQLLGK